MPGVVDAVIFSLGVDGYSLALRTVEDLLRRQVGNR
jgi:3-dehydroquinate dehydratase